jgi:hypothetical protein
VGVVSRLRHPYPEGEEFVTKCDADGCDRHSNECAVVRDDAAGEDRCDRHRLLPIGTRVKVIGDHEWVGPSSHALVGLVGTVAFAKFLLRGDIVE